MLKDVSFRAGRRSDKRRLVYEATQKAADKRRRIELEEYREKLRLWNESDVGRAAARRELLLEEAMLEHQQNGPTTRFYDYYRRWSLFYIFECEQAQPQPHNQRP